MVTKHLVEIKKWLLLSQEGPRQVSVSTPIAAKVEAISHWPSHSELKGALDPNFKTLNPSGDPSPNYSSSLTGLTSQLITCRA